MLEIIDLMTFLRSSVGISVSPNYWYHSKYDIPGYARNNWYQSISISTQHRRELFVRDISTLVESCQLVQNLDRSQIFSSLDTNYRNNTNKVTTVKSYPIQSQSESHCGSSNSTQKQMIKAKGFTVSHLDRFNRIDVLSVKGLVTLLHNA